VIECQTYRSAPDLQLLPSASSAIALANGKPGALWAVLGHTAARALVMAPAGIAAGAVVGVRPGAAVAIVIGAAIGIEIGIIALAMRQKRIKDEDWRRRMPMDGIPPRPEPAGMKAAPDSPAEPTAAAAAGGMAFAATFG
jgi:hypothetical protein